jgi:hypothetical protein
VLKKQQQTIKEAPIPIFRSFLYPSMSLPSISRSFSRSLGLRSISSKRITFRNLILSSSFLTLQPRRYFVQEPTSGVTKNTVDDNVGAPPIPEPSTTAFTSAQKLKSSPFQKFQTKPQTGKQLMKFILIFLCFILREQEFA